MSSIKIFVLARLAIIPTVCCCHCYIPKTINEGESYPAKDQCVINYPDDELVLSLNDLVVKTHSSSPETMEQRQSIYKMMILH